MSWWIDWRFEGGGGKRGVKSGGRGVVGRVGRLIGGGCSDEE